MRKTFMATLGLLTLLAAVAAFGQSGPFARPTTVSQPTAGELAGTAASPACVNVQRAPDGGGWGFANRCNYDINIQFCVENPNSSLSCQSGTHGGLTDVKANGFEYALPNYEDEGRGEVLFAVCFAPATPTRWHDSWNSRYSSDTYRFNPRPPRGGRRGEFAHSGVMLYVSIHAPRAGGDRRHEPGLLVQSRFNPRPPRGGRRRSCCHHWSGNWFQSTPPARGATQGPTGNPTGAWFQSTPPARGATRTI